MLNHSSTGSFSPINGPLIKGEGSNIKLNCDSANTFLGESGLMGPDRWIEVGHMVAWGENSSGGDNLFNKYLPST